MDRNPASVDIWRPNFVNIDQSMVTLRSSEGVEFKFHRAVLSQVSRYFRAAFKPNRAFVESESQQSILKYTCARTMDSVQQWVNTGSLDLAPDSTANYVPKMFDRERGEEVVNYGADSPVKCRGCHGLNQAKGGKGMVPWQEDLLNVIIFAEEYDFPALARDATIMWQSLDGLWQSLPPFTIVVDAFKALGSSSSICRYMTSIYRHYINCNFRKAQCNCCFTPSNDSPRPPSVRDLPSSFTERMVGDPLSDAGRAFDWCDFHNHTQSSAINERSACQEWRYNNDKFGKDEQFFRDLQRAWGPRDEQEEYDTMR